MMNPPRNESGETLQKMAPTSQCFHGPRALLLFGFSGSAQAEVLDLLNRLEMPKLPVIWADGQDSQRRLGDLFCQPTPQFRETDAALPRAIIAAGIEQAELHRLMNACRQAGIKGLLWAVLTPTSEKWPLSQLLNALAEEAKAMAAKRSKR